MSTTVIVIRGNSSQSLLNRIASALREETKEETQTRRIKKQVESLFEAGIIKKKNKDFVVDLNANSTTNKATKKRKTYTMPYKMNENQEKLVEQFVLKNQTFLFSNLKKFLNAAGYEVIHNKDLSTCLIKLNVKKVRIDNKQFWTAASIPTLK